MSFTGKVVLITGASSGIGADAARHLAKLGAKVSIVGRNQARLNEVVEQIVQAGSPKPLAITADVTQDAKRIIDETIEHFDQLDVLVNNAGIYGSDSVTEFNANEFDRFINTNLRSVLILTNLAVPHLEKTKGNIVNVSSVAGTVPWETCLSYCITKAGIDHFTKCEAIEFAKKRIRVNAIAPGDIRTPIFELAGVGDVDEYFEKSKADYLVGRVGEVSDTSAAIEYLASQSLINGIVLAVDGGLACSGPRRE